MSSVTPKRITLIKKGGKGSFTILNGSKIYNRKPLTEFLDVIDLEFSKYSFVTLDISKG